MRRLWCLLVGHIWNTDNLCGRRGCWAERYTTVVMLHQDGSVRVMESERR